MREILNAGEAGQRVARGPVGAYTWQLDGETFGAATLELLRTNDDIPIRRFLLQSPGELSRLRSEGRDDDASVVLDRTTCIASLGVELRRPEWLELSATALTQAYELGMDGEGLSRTEDPRNVELWLAILARAYGLGALAVRLHDWSSVRTLAVARPDGRDFDTYWQSWLRHAQVQAYRANILDQQTGVLATAHNEIRRLECLRPDVAEGDERVLSSLCQFDLLAAVAVSSARRRIDSSSYYTNFAPYYPSRSLPAVRRLLEDQDVRRAIAGDLTNTQLAIVLQVLFVTAAKEGRLLGGWHGVDEPLISSFLEEHLPSDFNADRREWIFD